MIDKSCGPTSNFEDSEESRTIQELRKEEENKHKNNIYHEPGKMIQQATRHGSAVLQWPKELVERRNQKEKQEWRSKMNIPLTIYEEMYAALFELSTKKNHRINVSVMSDFLTKKFPNVKSSANKPKFAIPNIRTQFGKLMKALVLMEIADIYSVGNAKAYEITKPLPDFKDVHTKLTGKVQKSVPASDVMKNFKSEAISDLPQQASLGEQLDALLTKMMDNPNVDTHVEIHVSMSSKEK